MGLFTQEITSSRPGFNASIFMNTERFELIQKQWQKTELTMNAGSSGS